MRQPTTASPRTSRARRIAHGARLGVVALGAVLATLLAAEAWLRSPLVPASLRSGAGQSTSPKGGGDTVETSGLPDTALYLRTGRGIRLRPDARVRVRSHAVSGRDVEIRTNAQGFRGPSLGPKSEDEVRVLVLGDSVTFGDYVDEAETYPAQISRMLRERAAGQGRGRRVEVVNAGIGSVGAREMVETLRDAGLSIQPDVVLVGLYLNDAESSLFLPPRDGSGPLGWSRLAQLVARRLDLLRLGAEQRSRFEARKAELSAFVSTHPVAEGEPWIDGGAGFDREVAAAFLDWGYAWSDAAWSALEPVLREMKGLAGERGAAFAVVLHPVRHQVESQRLRAEPQRSFEDLMARLGAPHLDLLPVLREASRNATEPLYYDHCHYTPEGNRMVAEAIADFLVTSVGRL